MTHPGILFMRALSHLPLGAVRGFGTLLGRLLFVLALPSGVFTESAAWMRFAAVILCGSLGGFLGVRSHPKKHLG